MPDYYIIRRGLVVSQLIDVNRNVANQELRAKATADLGEYELAQIMRVATPAVGPPPVVVNEVDRP